jgi:hypothetical protein
MKNIGIPETAQAYQADIMERAFPDPRIAENDFYRRLIGWVIDHRTPLLYEQTHPDEYSNLSINYNWLLQRDYSDTTLGPPPTVQSLYSLHESTHMTYWLPTRLNEVTASIYAEQFTASEYRASNESEILVHYRIPELRTSVFPGVRLAVDILKGCGIAQPPAQALSQVRALLVERDDFDHLAGDDPDVRAELTRIKQFNGNRSWAMQHYQLIRDRFTDPSLPLGDGLTDAEYEATIGAYEPHLSQEKYEENVIRNVRFAYAMCDLQVPFIATFAQARHLAEALEGRHALVGN